jgi:hypothetical protein
MATPVMAVELRPSTAQARIPSLRGYRDRKSIVCVRRIDSSMLPALGPRVLLMPRQSACEKNDHPVKSVDHAHGHAVFHVCCMVLRMKSWTTGLPCQKQKKRPVKGMHATLYTCGSHG